LSKWIFSKNPEYLQEVAVVLGKDWARYKTLDVLCAKFVGDPENSMTHNIEPVFFYGGGYIPRSYVKAWHELPKFDPKEN
jgi:hypothetical protein